MEISGRSERLYAIADKSFPLTIFWQPHLLILYEFSFLKRAAKFH